MKRLFLTATAALITAMAAPAQVPDDAMRKLKLDMEKMVAQSKVLGVAGSVMPTTVKGAPYSAMEVTETNQMLADGTRIHNESQINVYRDGEGRVRRETPEQITIMDPVAGTTYFLDPKTQTVRKGSLRTSNNLVFNRNVTGAGGVSASVEVRTDNGNTSVMVDGKPVDPSTIAQMKMRGELVPETATTEVVPLPRLKVMNDSPGAKALFYTKIDTRAGQSESLGKQNLEGVQSEGTRTTSTLPAGEIGNDRPIQTVSERWYSPELQAVMMTKHNDPRSGEETFRLTNVSRGEPSPDLFQVPPTYHTVEKM